MSLPRNSALCSLPPGRPAMTRFGTTEAGQQRIQIKGRAFGKDSNPGQRIGRIKPTESCDVVLLVLLDNATLEPHEMWEAPYAAVVARLTEPGSKARNERGALGVSEFKRMARRFSRPSRGKVAFFPSCPAPPAPCPLAP